MLGINLLKPSKIYVLKMIFQREFYSEAHHQSSNKMHLALIITVCEMSRDLPSFFFLYKKGISGLMFEFLCKFYLAHSI